jgi:hypothetical protein
LALLGASMAHSYVGAYVIGTFLNVALFGVSWVQTIQYMR